MHEPDIEEEEDTVMWASNYLEAYMCAQYPKIGRSPQLPVTWTAPTGSTIKINFDAGFNDDLHYQIAVVARSEGGGCVGWRVRCLTGQPSPEVGEAKAALEGVLFAVEKGWHDVILEGDSAMVVSAIQNQLHDSFLPYGATINHLLQSVRSFHLFSCLFIKRSGNRLAHALAHLSFEHSNSNVLDGLVLPADLASII